MDFTILIIGFLIMILGVMSRLKTRKAIEKLTPDFLVQQRQRISLPKYIKWVRRLHTVAGAQALTHKRKKTNPPQYLTDAISLLENEMETLEKQTGKPVLPGKKISEKLSQPSKIIRQDFIEKQSSPGVRIAIVLAILVAGGYFAWQYFGAQEGKVIKDETADWKTYRNEEYGFEMKYPEELLPTQPLQPKIKTIQCDYANFANKCPFVPIEGFTGSEESAIRQGFAGTPERITINDVPFCFQTGGEGAMGTSYATHKYTTVRDKKCFVVSFSVPYPNCSNILPIVTQKQQEMYDKCISGNDAKPETINQMLSTFKFIE